MKPPPFEYHAPSSLDEALSLLAEHGDEAKVLAGGQSLIPLMSLRLAHPAVIVDLNRVSNLSTIERRDGTIGLGAIVRERTAERSEDVQTAVPLLAAALPLVGHPAIRSRGTVGGSMAHADPAAELPAVAVALDAEMVATSKARGQRTFAAADFFLGFFTTALEPDEILTEVRFPVAGPGTGAAFEEACRRHGDFAMVGACAQVQLDGGALKEARVAMISVSDTPVRAREAEEVLSGATPSDDLFRAAAEAAARNLDPPSDLHASSAYRKHVGAVLVRRVLEKAVARAGGSG